MFVSITAPDADTDGEVRRWLSERDIYTPPSKQALIGHHLTVAMLSLPNAVALADRYPTLYLEVEDIEGQGLSLSRDHWSAAALSYEQATIDAIRTREQSPPELAPAPADRDEPGPDEGGAVGASSHRAWEVIDLDTKRTALGGRPVARPPAEGCQGQGRHYRLGVPGHQR